MASSKSSLVVFEDASIVVGRGVARRLLLERFNLDLKVGEHIGFAGPNGSGKSTILKTIIGQIAVASGRAKTVPTVNEISYMPQHYRKALFPWLSAQQNVALYKSERSVFSDHEYQSALSSFTLKIEPDDAVGRYSGGEQQLLLLALIVGQCRPLVLLDEPFSAIDVKRRKLARELIRRVLIDRTASLIIVSHDMKDIAELTDRAYLLSSGDHASAVTVTARGTSREDRDAYYKDLQRAVDTPNS